MSTAFCEEGEAGGAEERGVLAERGELDAALLDGEGLGPAAHGAAHGLEEEVGGLHEAAAQDDDLRVERADEVGGAHGQPLDGLVHRPSRRGVAAAGGLGHVLGRGGAEAPGERGAGGLRLERAHAAVVLAPARVEGEPAHGARDPAAAADEAAVRQDAGADAGAHGEEDDVGAVAGGALPLLAEDVARAVGVDDDRHRQARAQLVEERHLVAAPEVRGPGPAGCGL